MHENLLDSGRENLSSSHIHLKFQPPYCSRDQPTTVVGAVEKPHSHTPEPPLDQVDWFMSYQPYDGPVVHLLPLKNSSGHEGTRERREVSVAAASVRATWEFFSTRRTILYVVFFFSKVYAH
jgi:hypothetical protein